MRVSLRCGVWAAVLIVALTGTTVSAATFTYHGTLADAGRPADGSYDLQLTLYSAAEGGRVIGGPLTLHAVPVRGGAFSTQSDFGPLGMFAGQAWLGVAVRTSGKGEFAALSARAPVAPDATASVCPGAWTLDGNAGNPAGSYLGTADAIPLVFKVNAFQAGQISPSVDSLYPDAPSVVLGSSANAVGIGTLATGATVGGGGAATPACGPLANQPCSNVATGRFSTVSGGLFNAASGEGNTVGGGELNSASGPGGATVAGGSGNKASAASSSIGGGGANTASEEFSSIGGGTDNIASGFGSVVGGGLNNVASGLQSSVPGGNTNQAGGSASLAAGQHAHIRAAGEGSAGGGGDAGTFVWSDSSSGADFVSTGQNQFLVKASGGVAINGVPAVSNVELTIRGSATAGAGDNNVDLIMWPRNATGGIDLVASGTTQSDSTFTVYHTNGASFVQALSLNGVSDLTIGGTNAYKATAGSWLASSDRRIKERIMPVESPLDTLLRLQPVNFHYTAEYRSAHGDFADRAFLGFVAQDFAQVFPDAVSSNGERVPGAAASESPVLSLDSEPALVTTVAAVQELAAEAHLRDDTVARLSGENAQLRSQLDSVIARLQRLEAAGH